MYATTKGIVIRKELSDFDKIWNDYKKRVINTKQEDKKNVVFHFRIKTHGEIDEDNCHPFYINNGRTAFCHNGTLTNIKADKDDKRSDTVKFRDIVLNHLPKNWFRNPGIMTLIGNFVGYNKLVFMNEHGNVTFMNEKSGDWDNGIWYSNGSYKPVKVVHVHNRNGYNINDRRNGSETIDDDDYYENAYGIGAYCGHVPQLPSKIEKPIISDRLNEDTVTIKAKHTVKELLIMMKGPYVFEDAQEIDEVRQHYICKICANTIMRIDEVKTRTCTYCSEMRVINPIKEETSGTESRSHLH
jgi:hypothetical protein